MTSLPSPLSATLTLCGLFSGAMALGGNLHGADNRTSVQVYGNTLVVSAPAGSLTVPSGIAATPMHLDLHGAPISDVAEQIRRVTGLNVIVAPELLAGNVTLTMTVKNMPVSSVLAYVQRLTGVYVTFVNGALYFSLQRPTSEPVVRLYDVSDITIGVRDFPGPELRLHAVKDQGTLFDPPAGNPTAAALTPEDVAQLIRNILDNQNKAQQ